MRSQPSALVPLISPSWAQPRARRALLRPFAFGLSVLLLLGFGSAPRQVGAHAQGWARELGPMLNAASRLDDEDKLLAVNRFFNQRIRFRDDIEAWGEADHWASPLQLLDKGEGDCEDFAIAKYFSLRALGVPNSRLRLVYVRARLAGASADVQPHMVLAHYATLDAEPVILDNLVPQVLPAAQRDDLTPMFSFNGSGLWLGTGTRGAGDPAARLPRWRELLARARAEGFP